MLNLTQMTAVALSLLILPVSAEGIKGSPLPKKQAGKKSKKGAPLTAGSIIKDMRAAAAFIASQGRKDMDPKSKLEVPFWSGLKLVMTSLNQLEKGLKKRDAAYLKALEGLGRGTTQVATAWAVLRKNEKTSTIGRGVIALHKGYRTFDTHFGPQVARMKQGGKLSEKESAEITKQKATVAKLKSQLAKMKAKAKPDTIEMRFVVDLEHQCRKVTSCEVRDLSHFAQFIYFIGELEDYLYAYFQIVEVWYPEFYTTWKGCDSYYTSFSTASWQTDATYYATWDISTVTISHYGDYYEEMVVESAADISEESTFVESYSEESATEEIAGEESVIEEEYDSDESNDAEESMSEEIGEDDADGDGISNEDDADDDNDGTADTDDNDDDGDGMADADDDEPDGGDAEADDSDDDGVADDMDSDDDNDGSDDAGGGDDDSGGDDGGGDDSGGGDDGS